MTTATIATNYFVTVQELTAHNTASAKETVAPTPTQLETTLTPLLPYAPLVLFTLLFVVAFGLLVINRVKTLKNIGTALLLALVTASIPAIISYVGTGTRQTTNAGPDEIPREVRVRADTPTFVVISWHTDAKHTGVVRFGVAPLTTSTARVYIANDQTEVSDHSIRIGGLKPGKTYEFEILSGTTWYDNSGVPIKFTEQ